MKKLFTILCLGLLTCSLSAQIQGETRFGVVAGLNMAYPVGDDAEDVIDEFDDMIDYADDQNGIDAEGGVKPRIGMHAGFVFDYFLVDNIALSSGFIYSQKGFVIDYEMEGMQYQGYPYYNYTNNEEELHIATKLNYFDIPIGVKYATDEGFELSAGFVISILASDNVDYDLDADYNNSYYSSSSNDIDDYEDAWGEDPEETLTGLQIGVGYTFNETFNISFKLQKTGEFGEIYWGNEGGDENKNLTLQVSTGLYF